MLRYGGGGGSRGAVRQVALIRKLLDCDSCKRLVSKCMPVPQAGWLLFPTLAHFLTWMTLAAGTAGLAEIRDTPPSAPMDTVMFWPSRVGSTSPSARSVEAAATPGTTW